MFPVLHFEYYCVSDGGYREAFKPWFLPLYKTIIVIKVGLWGNFKALHAQLPSSVQSPLSLHLLQGLLTFKLPMAKTPQAADDDSPGQRCHLDNPQAPFP